MTDIQTLVNEKNALRHDIEAKEEVRNNLRKWDRKLLKQKFVLETRWGSLEEVPDGMERELLAYLDGAIAAKKAELNEKDAEISRLNKFLTEDR